MTGSTTPLAPAKGSDATGPTAQQAWDQLVAVAMLGTDRRNPPDPIGLVADVVDDTVRAAPSERMLAQVAATVAIRRAGVLPGPARPAVAGPPPDDRSVCVPAAAERWHHVITSWPVLEDEWMLTLIANGWRVPPDLVPDVLARHRNDPVRRVRAELACGPLAGWLVGHLPDLAARGAARTQPDPSVESVSELPELPIPADLQPLLVAPAKMVAQRLVAGIATGVFAHAHRAVLVNLVARVSPSVLPELAAALDSVDASSPGFPLATVLADLAHTRHHMLDELGVTIGV